MKAGFESERFDDKCVTLRCRIVTRLRAITRSEQASRIQPCAKVVDARTLALAACGAAQAQTVAYDRVIAPSEVLLQFSAACRCKSRGSHSP